MVLEDGLNQESNFIIGKDKKESDFKSRKEYLVYLPIQYIITHTGYIGIDDKIFFDEAECDGYALANDLVSEFDFNDEVIQEIL